MRGTEQKKGRTGVCSRLSNILEPGEPCILFNSNSVEAEYKCFSIQDLFKDLFLGDSDTKPILSTVEMSRDKKELLSFILPIDILMQISAWKTTKGDCYITEDGPNNDYKGFFLSSVNNNKIISILHKIFSNNGSKTFIEKVREHIINNLLTIDLLDNPTLMDYLKSVGQDTIVPSKVSSLSNKAFCELLVTRNHHSISIIIANFFISALLGLRSVKFPNSKKDYRKAYLLNGLGMEYIWRPDLITTSYEKLQNIKQLYDFGEYKTAYQQINVWLEDYVSLVGSEELANAYQLIGLCMYKHPTGCISASKSNFLSEKELESIEQKGITFLEKCIAITEPVPEVHYLLFEYYKNLDRKKAQKYLNKAFTLKYAKAVIEVVYQFLSNYNSTNNSNPNIAKNELYVKLNSIINNSQTNTDIDVGECLYLRGLLKQKDGDSEDAENDFVLAAQKGHEKASLEMRRKERVDLQSIPSFLTSSTAPCCFVNSLSGNNLAILSTFPSNEWSIFSLNEGVHTNNMNITTVHDVDEFITKMALDKFSLLCPRMVILFMSEDENKNLNECLIFLDKLFNIVLNASEYQRWNIIDLIDIYVGAKYETASMLIDANISDMGKDIYFKVHIADESRDTAHHLLCDAPLFVPFLNKSKKENSANIVLFGCTETNYRFIKESIACAYMDIAHPVTITLLGTDADHFARRLRQECPGMYSNPHVACIEPSFISCELSEADFPSYIYGYNHDNFPDDPIVHTLKQGNYFIVDISNDYENIQFAMELRTWLLRSRGTFNRTPFIAVKCSNIQNSYLANHLTVSGQVPGSSYYSKYDLFTFGMVEKIYSYQCFIKNHRLEEVALRIHKSYNGGNDRQIENDYYSFSYNADSSRLTAIGLSYRMFAGGAFFNDKTMYQHCGALNTPTLSINYSLWLENTKNVESAAVLEQSRWNGFMLSRGWEPASVRQVQAYKEQSTGTSHRHLLGKLHPFIREWDDFNNKELMKILGILKTRFDYKKNPQEITRQSIRDTANFLDKTAVPPRGEER